MSDDRLAHLRELEQRAVAAFAAQQWRASFRYIDRRCRLRPPAGPNALLLRAQVSLQLGDRPGALADLRSARDLDPLHVGSLRALLDASDDPTERQEAARALVNVAEDWSVLSAALGELASAEFDTFGALRRDGDVVRGWAAWRSAAPRLVHPDVRESRVLRAEPDHPLASPSWRACGFTLPVPRPGTRVAIVWARNDASVLAAPLPPVAVALPEITAPEGAPLTVIMPVYGDAGATEACLVSLLEAGGLGRHQLILVDDASPDPAIAALLEGFEGDPRVRVLRNPVNLGFAATVNRALGSLDAMGDVVVLNADTVVPPGALDRLRAAAYASPEIGTATPVSNNGEFTSFPLAFEVNPLSDAAGVAILDRAAAAANGTDVVDLPSGIGFCLLITAGCLAAVGGLSERYARGYLEDVDYCLRAREAGFRNVCATGVFVGHAGSRSFAGAKRALVLANERRLAAHFPGHGAETAVFIGADPLRKARARIEAHLPPSHRGGILLVGSAPAPTRHGTTRLRSGLEQVAANLAAHSHVGLEMRVGVRDGKPDVSLFGLGGAQPQNLQFDLSQGEMRASLREIVRAHAPICITVYETAGLTDALFDDLKTLGVPMDLVVSDAGLLCPRGTLRQTDGFACVTLGEDAVCEGCLGALGGLERASSEGASASSPARYRAVWRERARAFDAIFVDGSGTAAFVRRRLPDVANRIEVAPELAPGRLTAATAGKVLGAVVLRAEPSTDAFLRALARSPERADGVQMVVLGQSIEDRALLATRDTWVTGPIADAADFARLIEAYAIDALVIADPVARFGHEADALARATGCPLAVCDWAGEGSARRGHLALDPASSFAEAAASVHRWHTALDGHHLLPSH